MNGRGIQYFFAAIFFVGVYSALLPHSQDPNKETQYSRRAEISFKNIDRKYASENCNVAAAKPHNYSGFLLSLLVAEVEETDDEKEVSDFQVKQENLLGGHNETTFVDFLSQSDRVSPVPLFIFLHSWKHFLS